RIGQENLADQYHIRVYARDAKGAQQNRFAVDREGNPIFWGNLIVTGATAPAQITTPIEGFAIIAESKASAGPDIRWQAVKRTTIQGQETFRITFRGKRGSSEREVEDELILETALKPAQINAALQKFNLNSKLVKIGKM